MDGSFIIPGRVGGSEHMLKNLVVGLAQASVAGDTIEVLTDHPWEASDPVRFRALLGLGNRFVRITRTLMERRDRYDAILFANYFTPPFPRSARRPRFVTVIDDLQHRYMTVNFSLQKRIWLNAAHRTTLRLADATVAISDAVRVDIGACYGSKWLDRVQTIHNPISWERFGSAEAAGPAPVAGPYVLAVAAHYAHKNLETLVDAFAEVRKRMVRTDVHLLLVGQLGQNLRGIKGYRPVGPLIAKLDLHDAVHVAGYLDDRRLGDAYRNATMFAFPSLFEGFAMPPVEALGFRLPVLTSRVTSMPEVTLGMAEYLDDPLDVTEMSERIAAMLSAPGDFTPSAGQAAKIRATYEPARIGASYRRILAS